MQKTITTEVVIAYSLCPRKAFLLLCSTEGKTQEHSHVLQMKKEATQKNYIKRLEQQVPDVQPYSMDNFKSGKTFLVNATINAENLEAH